MTLYQLSSRACQKPMTLALLRRQCALGDTVLLLEAIGEEQLNELQSCIGGADLCCLVIPPHSTGNTDEPYPSIDVKGWLELIAQANQTVTL